jgi:hypothetical protein
MSTSIRKYVIGAGVSCALAMSFTSPSQAFPVLTNTATVNASMPSMVTDVRYYGRGYGGHYYGRGYGYRGYGYGGAAAAGLIGGLAAGAIIGSAAANNGYYYGPGPYAYGGGPYAYEPAPVYVQPRYYRGGYYDGGSSPCWPCY